MIEYKGYFAKVEFDDDAGIFHGEVINLRDVITFEGETAKGLKQAFQDSVDDYLAFCAERGEDPEGLPLPVQGQSVLLHPVEGPFNGLFPSANAFVPIRRRNPGLPGAIHCPILP